MMKRFWFIAVLMLTCSINLMAQRDVVQWGARVGMDMWLTNRPTVVTPGPIGGLDMSYSFLREVDRNKYLGVRIGAGIAYGMSGHSIKPYREEYTNVDYYAESMDYTITADRYSEWHRNLQAEVPLMLDFQTTDGFCFAIGIKGMMTLLQQRQIRIRNPYVLTYYPDFEVPIYNELVTGKLTDQNEHSGRGVLPRFNALVSADFGYEWKLPYTKSRLGLHAYIDYSVWGNYSNNPVAQRLIDIAPITNIVYPVPNITTNYLTDTYSQHLNYMSVGLRLTYSFVHDRKCFPCKVYLW